ncbi:hypothetical protein B484DRAFT_447741 [Ochromonadaceae sp. CCMP2298]|nr:hypothetical protein B484DRAFT_447741 [Ochromonadaceae sp. CCMP2298]|mmetsp:Transcript_11410/g.25354  ORF Transcript_11410/g.25354 Transcript_11410/m.25354 type:complete len:301 (-) Transcript_11410:185-1087(-)
MEPTSVPSSQPSSSPSAQPLTLPSPQPSSLTEEQKQRMRENRQRALDILERKKKEREQEQEQEQEQQEREKQSQKSHEQSSGSNDSGINDAPGSKEKEKPLLCQFLDDNEGGECSSLYIDEALYETFGEQVCSACKASTDLFDLLTKADGAKAYLVTDDAFKFLRHQSKNNPHHAGWTAMKLYLRKHLRALAVRRFGSLGGLEEERQLRATKSFERDLLKTKEALAASTKDLWESATTTEGGKEVVVLDGEPEEELGAANRSYGSQQGKKRKGQAQAPSAQATKKKKQLASLVSIIRGGL